jgi:hypothetical protein
VEPIRPATPEPRSDTGHFDQQPSVPFDTPLGFEELIVRALAVAAKVEEPYATVLKLLEGCEEVGPRSWSGARLDVPTARRDSSYCEYDQGRADRLVQDCRGHPPQSCSRQSHPESTERGSVNVTRGNITEVERAEALDAGLKQLVNSRARSEATKVLDAQYERQNRARHLKAADRQRKLWIQHHVEHARAVVKTAEEIAARHLRWARALGWFAELDRSDG